MLGFVVEDCRIILVDWPRRCSGLSGSIYSSLKPGELLDWVKPFITHTALINCKNIGLYLLPSCVQITMVCPRPVVSHTSIVCCFSPTTPETKLAFCIVWRRGVRQVVRPSLIRITPLNPPAYHLVDRSWRFNIPLQQPPSQEQSYFATIL